MPTRRNSDETVGWAAFGAQAGHWPSSALIGAPQLGRPRRRPGRPPRRCAGRPGGAPNRSAPGPRAGSVAPLLQASVRPHEGEPAGAAVFLARQREVGRQREGLPVGAHGRQQAPAGEDHQAGGVGEKIVQVGLEPVEHLLSRLHAPRPPHATPGQQFVVAVACQGRSTPQKEQAITPWGGADAGGRQVACRPVPGRCWGPGAGRRLAAAAGTRRRPGSNRRR